MAHFDKPDQIRALLPTKHQYLRSTRNLQFQSYTCYNGSVATEVFTDSEGNDTAPIRFLQAGEVMAKVTSGDGVDMVGPYQLDVTDGRADLANLVGVNETYCPWQLNERNVDISVLYHGVVKFGWCTIRDATGARVPMTAAVADALYGKRGLDVNSK